MKNNTLIDRYETKRHGGGDSLFTQTTNQRLESMRSAAALAMQSVGNENPQITRLVPAAVQNNQLTTGYEMFDNGGHAVAATVSNMPTQAAYNAENHMRDARDLVQNSVPSNTQAYVANHPREYSAATVDTSVANPYQRQNPLFTAGPSLMVHDAKVNDADVLDLQSAALDPQLAAIGYHEEPYNVVA